MVSGLVDKPIRGKSLPEKGCFFVNYREENHNLEFHMTKIFSLLAACFVATASFAQEATPVAPSAPEEIVQIPEGEQDQTVAQDTTVLSAKKSNGCGCGK